MEGGLQPIWSSNHMSRSPSQNSAKLRNLSRRPSKPALGNGRVQVMVRRAFLMTDRETLSTSELKAVVYCRRQHRDGHVDRELCRSIRRVAERLCVRVARTPMIGRPWLWRLKPEFADRPPWRAAHQ